MKSCFSNEKYQKHPRVATKKIWSSIGGKIKYRFSQKQVSDRNKNDFKSERTDGWVLGLVNSCMELQEKQPIKTPQISTPGEKCRSLHL